MDATERARLRALYEGIAMPWEAVEHHKDGECFGRVSILCDGGDFPPDEVALIDMGHDTECDEAHAALIVGAVNALPALLDDADAADARSAKAERERDEARDRVAVLETVLREIAGSLRSHERMGPRWCLHCGVAWGTQHVATCPAGRALRVLDGRDAR